MKQRFNKIREWLLHHWNKNGIGVKIAGFGFVAVVVIAAFTAVAVAFWVLISILDLATGNVRKDHLATIDEVSSYIEENVPNRDVANCMKPWIYRDIASANSYAKVRNFPEYKIRCEATVAAAHAGFKYDASGNYSEGNEE